MKGEKGWLERIFSEYFASMSFAINNRKHTES